MSLGETETGVVGQVSAESLMHHVASIAQWERVSGTPGERQAVEYIARSLEEYGLATRLYEVESLVGWPEHAAVEVLGPRALSLRALAHALAPSTSPEGLTGELVYLGAGGESDFERHRVAGKIVVTEGLPSPLKVLLAQGRGAACLVGIGKRFHDLCVSPVWGTPTPDTARYLPRIPVVTVVEEEAAPLRSLLERGPVTARVHARTFRGWRTTLLLTADIPGLFEPEDFVLLSGHHCSWYYGAMDNGAANATMLEVARLLSRHRRALRRGVRLAFWPGHTQGRYSGSTWYCDRFWEDLYDHCVLHVNVDSTGARGADLFRALCMPEVRGLAVAAIHDVTGVRPEPERIPRAGDQSFWGCGISALFMDLSHVPSDQAADTGSSLFTAAGERAPRPQGGLPWWWHTPEDTLDKIDPENLRRDTQIYLLAVWRAATMPVLPLRFGATAHEIRRTLEEYQRQGAGRFSLDALIDRAREVEAATSSLDRLADAIQDGDDLPEEVLRMANRRLLAVGRALVPAYFSSVERFDQDLAIPIPPVPSLEGIRRLVAMDPGSDEYRFLLTALVRGRNRTAFYLRQALEEARAGCAELEAVLSA